MRKRFMHKAYPRLRERMGRAVRKRRVGSRVAGLSGRRLGGRRPVAWIVHVDQLGGRTFEEDAGRHGEVGGDAGKLA